ncbi:hypothetical protein H8S23_03600 [Anaerofilum sp. BX8]|uniref:Uncharacterized protein n=1 Tax=Anaerofilum hominis TaxID=2763016 RepID=A0A923L0M3_9FIRM|nr:hypothetical protein [Anaerofilum hominis]MBC5580582.1 hypothetical protein [Anaerofilum hominis]
MTKQLKKRPIEKELNFLTNFEIYGALMFAALYFATKYIVDMDFGKEPFKLNWISFYPLLVFSIIVIEGSFYWRNKLKKVKRKKSLSNIQIGRIYHKLRWINVILLTAYLPAIIITALVKENLSGIVVGTLFYLMAVIEQINYFHIRLSYETVNGALLVVEPLKQLLTGTGRRSALRKDIDAYLGVEKNRKQNSV